MLVISLFNTKFECLTDSVAQVLNNEYVMDHFPYRYNLMNPLANSAITIYTYFGYLCVIMFNLCDLARIPWFELQLYWLIMKFFIFLDLLFFV